MNLDIYTTEMSKSIWDKAFFMDKIPDVKYVIDFGCADGAMIHYLAPLFPDIKFIGYDINEELIERARAKTPFHANEIYFTDVEAVIAYLHFTPIAQPEEICINFSSVLHEVFSSTGGIDTIQRLLDELKPRYVTIRDMYCDDTIELNLHDASSYAPILDVITEDKTLLDYGHEFKDKFGLIKTWRDLTHLMMKLQWIDNGWEDEMKENYFSWKLEDILKLTGNNYSPIFECRYQLPYLGEKWRKDYNGFYNPDIHTHAQFILRRDD